MSKADFIELANVIRNLPVMDRGFLDRALMIEALAAFCANRSASFKKGVWLDYVYGRCGPNGGSVRARKSTALKR
jgi:hypothetical protein